MGSRFFAVLIASTFAAHAAGAGVCDLFCAAAEWFQQSGGVATHHSPAAADCHTSAPTDAAVCIASPDPGCEHASAVVVGPVERAPVKQPGVAALVSPALFQRELTATLCLLPAADPPGIRLAYAAPLRL